MWKIAYIIPNGSSNIFENYFVNQIIITKFITCLKWHHDLDMIKYEDVL